MLIGLQDVLNVLEKYRDIEKAEKYDRITDDIYIAPMDVYNTPEDMADGNVSWVVEKIIKEVKELPRKE